MNASSYNPGIPGGNREDLRGPLSILEPEETPFVSLCKKGPGAKAVYVEFGADVLRPARTIGSREGWSGAKGGNKVARRRRFGTYLQRWMDEYGVTDVQQDIAQAGGSAWTTDEYANSKAKTVREVKRDLEATCLGIKDGIGGADDEMQTRSAFKWLDATQTPAVPADFLCPASQRLVNVADLAETGPNGLNTVLKSLKSRYGGSREYQMIAGNDYCEDVDLFTRVDVANPTQNQRYKVQEANTSHQVTLMVKVFLSSFGRVNIIPSDFLRIDLNNGVGDPKAALILNMELWEIMMLEELHSADNTPDAGGFTGYVKAIGALGCHNPKGNACIVGSASVITLSTEPEGLVAHHTAAELKKEAQEAAKEAREAAGAQEAKDRKDQKDRKD